MIPTKHRRLKTLKLPKNLERQYKELKCRDCTVKVTRMDFAKILGKFTKVKIKFETVASPKPKRTVESSPTSRLKANENGMVQVHRSAYNQHPAKKLLGINKKSKQVDASSPKQTSNVLKENNRIKKSEPKCNEPGNEPDDIKMYETHPKHYGIIFESPTSKKKDIKSKINLDNLLPSIDKSILPSEDWCIDYFPKRGEPKDDKIYDRIAAELEDLMYNEKTKNSSNGKEDKNDDFPSILDILNDTSKGTDKGNTLTPVNLESSDVEAMLLGKTKSSESSPMHVDNTNATGENAQPSADETKTTLPEVNCADENPNSPSILDEPEVSDVPVLSVAEKPLDNASSDSAANQTLQPMQIDENDNNNTKNKNNIKSGVTQVIFKKSVNGTSSKTVICPKNLKYSVSIQGKSIELLGAPNVISSLEDLQVLLQIVEESDLTSLYVLH